MRPLRFALLILLPVGCAIPGFEHDPHSVAPAYDRWEAVVAAPADSTYAAALASVLQSGYTLALASRSDRVITTNLRREFAASGLDATSFDMRYTVSVLPVGADSSRLSVIGHFCFGDDLTECGLVTARHGGRVGAWQFVRRLGEAALTRLPS
jgi:hypothetical protein